MIHIDNILKFFVILIGFSYIIGCFILLKKTRIIEYSYYLKGYFALFTFHLTDLIRRYLLYTIDNNDINIYLITFTVLYASLALFLANFIRLTIKLIEVENKSFLNRLSELIYIIFLAVYLFAIRSGYIEKIEYRVADYLWRVGIFFQIPILIISTLLLCRYRLSFRYVLAKKLVHGFSIIMTLYIPLLILEIFLTDGLVNILKYKDLRITYITFLLWTLYSIYIYIRWDRDSSRKLDRGNLSSREKEIVKLIVVGKSAKEISEMLYISPRTVEKHISNIYKKSEVSNRVELLKVYS